MALSTVVRQSVPFAVSAVSRFNSVMSRGILLTTLAVICLGCDARIERFDPNRVYALTVERTRSAAAEIALADAAEVAEQVFGTPNQPLWPSELFDDPSLASLVDADRLTRAAGPVSSDREGVNHGLYRKHCVNCHALDGSGAGPSSLFQNPYPRDFRHGVFKWKSTERYAKPTRDDLRGVLNRGVAGTAMPSFTLIEPDDLEALVDYVIYLSIRGEVERRLVAGAVDELGYAETAPDEEELRLVSATDDTEAADLVRDVVDRVAKSWSDADRLVVPVPSPQPLSDEEISASIKRGRDLFHGPIANCVGCHGPAGNGVAVTVDYDDWAKEYSTRLGLTPTDGEAMRPFHDAGALPPRQTEPRSFAGGVFRGGGAPQSIYRRISEGIAGTPMPGVEIVAQPSRTSLSESQAWDLVRYVRFLAEDPSAQSEPVAEEDPQVAEEDPQIAEEDPQIAGEDQ
jgi:mono/diheme cytochrome c family protein